MKRPWWWRINPWLALARKERAYKEALRIVREQAIEIASLEIERQDAARFRWLTEDHADKGVRTQVESICRSIPVSSVASVRLSIDANRWKPEDKP